MVTSAPAVGDRVDRSAGRVCARVVAVFVAVAAFTSACADHEDQALCPAFAEYVAVADAVRAADPTGATADEVVDTVDVLRGELGQLRAVADQRYRAPIDELDALLADLRRTLGSIQDDAEYSTWEPLVDDTLDDVSIADVRLRRAIDPACRDRNTDDESAGAAGGEL